MYAITGITGQVGSAVAEQLLAERQPVCALLRNEAKAGPWRARGCTVRLADMGDAEALEAAMEGADGLFLLIPPMFDPAPGFPEVGRVIAALSLALERTRQRNAAPQRVVCLSTIGAQAPQTNLLSQLGLVEEALRAQPLPVCFLRAAWFMENSAADLAAARSGTIRSHLQPLDQPFPMVATADIGRLAASLLRERWSGARVVELEGPHPVSPNDLAAAWSRVLGRPVRAEAVARSEWEDEFRAAGARNPEPRARMLDGFNENWIRFEHPDATRKGTTEIDAVLRSIHDRSTG